MTAPGAKSCPCCIEGQRPGMYDDGKPAACGGCPHLVSEHARVNRPACPPSVAADGPEGVFEGSGTHGPGTGALRAELAAMLADRDGPKVIWKYMLVVGKHGQDVLMPKYAKVIHVGVQIDHPVFWAIVDPQQPVEARRFLILATGQPIPAEATEYHGTVQMPYGLVWHVMEARTT